MSKLVEDTKPISGKIQVELSFDEAKEIIKALYEDASRKNDWSNWYLLSMISAALEEVDESLV